MIMLASSGTVLLMPGCPGTAYCTVGARECCGGVYGELVVLPGASIASAMDGWSRLFEQQRVEISRDKAGREEDEEAASSGSHLRKDSCFCRATMGFVVEERCRMMQRELVCFALVPCLLSLSTCALVDKNALIVPDRND